MKISFTQPSGWLENLTTDGKTIKIANSIYVVDEARGEYTFTYIFKERTTTDALFMLKFKYLHSTN